MAKSRLSLVIFGSLFLLRVRSSALAGRANGPGRDCSLGAIAPQLARLMVLLLELLRLGYDSSVIVSSGPHREQRDPARAPRRCSGPRAARNSRVRQARAVMVPWALRVGTAAHNHSPGASCRRRVKKGRVGGGRHRAEHGSNMMLQGAVATGTHCEKTEHRNNRYVR